MPKEIHLSLNRDIYTGYSSHNLLSEFSAKLNQAQCDHLFIDISKIRFIASNQFAILGCLLDHYQRAHDNTRLFLKDVQPSVLEIMRKNNFGSIHFDMDRLPDTYNTVIPYKVFSVQEINEYRDHINRKIFNRKDLPKMTSMLKSTINDYMLEVFKNVVDHTSSEFVYTCGQFFPKSSMLYFTVADHGETIPYNVLSYFKKNQRQAPSNILDWALQVGTTTSNDQIPRGVGLYLIRKFIQENQGELFIISGKENYELNANKERYLSLCSAFPGTIVTLAFNLNDSVFHSTGSDDTEIIF